MSPSTWDFNIYLISVCEKSTISGKKVKIEFEFFSIKLLSFLLLYFISIKFIFFSNVDTHLLFLSLACMAYWMKIFCHRVFIFCRIFIEIDSREIFFSFHSWYKLKPKWKKIQLKKMYLTGWNSVSSFYTRYF
jgi:hypothetical protein